MSRMQIQGANSPLLGRPICHSFEAAGAGRLSRRSGLFSGRVPSWRGVGLVSLKVSFSLV